MLRRRLLGALSAAVALRAGAVDSLTDPMNRFAAAYNEFAASLRNGVFDARAARRLSRLWRDIERSGNWPEPK